MNNLKKALVGLRKGLTMVRVLLFLVVFLASLWVISTGFEFMNQKSDWAFLGGIILLALGLMTLGMEGVYLYAKGRQIYDEKVDKLSDSKRGGVSHGLH